MEIHCEREREREREREGFGMNGEDRVAFSAERDFKFWGNR